MEMHRTRVVDYIYGISLAYQFDLPIFFRSIQIMDLYLSRKSIPLLEFQLLALTCSLLAVKLEDHPHPYGIYDIEYCADGQYTRQQFIDQEMDVLVTLDFDMNWPTVWCFADLYLNVCHNSNVIDLVLYLVKLCTHKSFFFHGYDDNLVAEVCICIAQEILKLPSLKTTENTRQFIDCKSQVIQTVRESRNWPEQTLRASNARTSARLETLTDQLN